MKCTYPEICTPHAKLLCRLLERERIRIESPDWTNRSIEHDIVDDLQSEFGWPIFVLSGDAETFDLDQRTWAEYSLSSVIIDLAKPRASLFIKQVRACMASTCDCAKKATGGQ